MSENESGEWEKTDSTEVSVNEGGMRAQPGVEVILAIIAE